ncbi:elongation factor G [Aliiroseovarius subalbicans]|uniref:elongation factor G n=1 Tax=Aliiroseovarius subalbicans TaxID=2925840 RepID=UPI001F5AF596|nr:elongation factor G [Aliiroseovarius subalbicans]MCI2399608.1 elongation factor G [Aliiroseovarius subalbicans]
MATSIPHSPRTALICGPYLSGKTSVFEALLTEAGALQPHASAQSAFTIADHSPEALAHGMSTEMNVATADYLEESWTFIDVPGSVELGQEMRDAMDVADIAVVVVDPDPAKAVTFASHLKALENADIPHVIFINKFDRYDNSARELMEAFQAVSSKPLLLREIPIHEGGQVTGYVDLVSERAFQWEEGKPSTLIKLPETVLDREAEARTEMLEGLADFDDGLLEKLLEDVTPSTTEVYDDMTKDLAEDLVVPVFFGSATQRHGIHRLMKSLRHDAPDVTRTAARMGVSGDSAQLKVLKTLQAGHAGKMSIARVMSGTLKSGDTLNGERPAGINTIFGGKLTPVKEAGVGAVVGLTKLDSVQTGDLLTPTGRSATKLAPIAPAFAQAIKATRRADDVKLGDNLRKLMDEDRSLSVAFDAVNSVQVLEGQGEMHLKLCLERLENRTGLKVDVSPPEVAYRETIRKPAEKRVRHKKQSGGHGEFGEVEIKIAPVARGAGNAFNETIHGGAVPRQYLSAVEHGVTDALEKGPLGYPVVDVSATLTDGKHHSVDSSEMAFRKAAGQAMREALADAKPVKLEPINAVSIAVPDQFIAGVQKIVMGRRGQILGIEARDGWTGWEQVQCQIPAAEMGDLIMELRSATMGVGSFTSEFDHLQDV